MRALFLVGAALAFGVWLCLPDSDPRTPTAPSPAEPAGSEDSVAIQVATGDPPSQREIAPEPDLDGLEPWHPAVLARAPKDRFGFPLEQKPFLHSLIPKNWPEGVENGRCNVYCVNLDELIDALPPDAQKRAEARWKELAGLVKDLTDAAREIAIEHWRVRARDLHRAIEAGDFVLVEYDRELPDYDRAMLIAEAKDSLNLGLNTRDYYEIISGARASSPDRYASAFIYCTREKYPEGLELLAECGRLRKAALARICEHLGVSPEHCAQIWYW